MVRKNNPDWPYPLWQWVSSGKCVQCGLKADANNKAMSSYHIDSVLPLRIVEGHGDTRYCGECYYNLLVKEYAEVINE